jgi:hypothetical protein
MSENSASPHSGRTVESDESEHIGVEIERLAEVTPQSLSYPIEILHGQRAIEPIGLTNRLDALGACPFTRQRHRQIARGAQQQEGQR